MPARGAAVGRLKGRIYPHGLLMTLLWTACSLNRLWRQQSRADGGSIRLGFGVPPNRAVAGRFQHVVATRILVLIVCAVIELDHRDDRSVRATLRHEVDDLLREHAS
jgi:hypothetical protein